MNYDIIIVGGGPGGYVAAIKARQMGAKVALIEKNALGGVCLNVGCIPTKALLKSAKVYKYIKNASKFGIDLNQDSVKVNWQQMQKRKETVVKKLTSGVAMLLKKNGVDTYQGEGKIIDANTVEVNGKSLNTKNLILAMGSSPFIPPIEGAEEELKNNFVLTSTSILALDEIPNDLTIIGGGVIGVEFATLFASLGSKVTIVERAPHILINVDKDIRVAMTKILKRDSDIKVLTNVNVTRIFAGGYEAEIDGKKQTFKTDKVLMSIGRTPNSEQVSDLNIKLNRKAIETNERMETSIPGVYAIGDLNGKSMLAHVASSEGIVAVENIMGVRSSLDYRKIPSCIYSFPEIATVGFTEEEAIEHGHKIITSTFPLSANGKALAEGESEGFVKIIVDEKYKEVIGMHMLAPNATDMIAEAVTTMELEGTVYELAKAIHPHPTLSEIVMEAAHGAIDEAIHI